MISIWTKFKAWLGHEKSIVAIEEAKVQARVQAELDEIEAKYKALHTPSPNPVAVSKPD